MSCHKYKFYWFVTLNMITLHQIGIFIILTQEIFTLHLSICCEKCLKYSIHVTRLPSLPFLVCCRSGEKKKCNKKNSPSRHSRRFLLPTLAPFLLQRLLTTNFLKWMVVMKPNLDDSKKGKPSKSDVPNR